MELSIRLEIRKGPGRGHVFSHALAPGELITIGRRQQMDVRLPKPNVSALHCEIRNIGGELHLVDRARNPTRVNGERVEGSRVLQPDDILLVGPFHLHVDIEEEGGPLSSSGGGALDLRDEPIGAEEEEDSRDQDQQEGFGETGRFLSLSPLVGKVIGGCTVMHTIGEGSSSEVFFARRVTDQAGFALKILRQAMPATPVQVKRFRREARLLEQLDHRRVMRVFDGGEQDGVLYILCEHLQGSPLDTLLRDAGTLRLRPALTIAHQLVDALSYAADRGIIHRDVNPRNLFVRARRGKIDVKLLDFGLGKQTMSMTQLTGMGVGFGTPGYMAPELLDRASQADLRADIHGVGAVLYRMLAGQAPRQCRNFRDLLAQVSQAIPSLGDVLEQCPAAVVRLVDRCLRARPEERYQTYAELRRDILQARKLLL